MQNLFPHAFRLRPKPDRTPHRTLRFTNAIKKMPPDHCNRLPIAKVRAVVEVVKLGPERANHFVLRESVHVTK